MIDSKNLKKSAFLYLGRKLAEELNLVLRIPLLLSWGPFAGDEIKINWKANKERPELILMSGPPSVSSNFENLYVSYHYTI